MKFFAVSIFYLFANSGNATVMPQLHSKIDETVDLSIARNFLAVSDKIRGFLLGIISHEGAAMQPSY